MEFVFDENAVRVHVWACGILFTIIYHFFLSFFLFLSFFSIYLYTCESFLCVCDKNLTSFLKIWLALKRAFCVFMTVNFTFIFSLPSLEFLFLAWWSLLSLEISQFSSAWLLLVFWRPLVSLPWVSLLVFSFPRLLSLVSLLQVS